jgi:hypothetical protein
MELTVKTIFSAGMIWFALSIGFGMVLGRYLGRRCPELEVGGE